MIIWDWKYPSFDASVLVLKVENEDVLLVFDESFFITEIHDFNNDGIIEFKGKSTCEKNDTIKTVKIE